MFNEDTNEEEKYSHVINQILIHLQQKKKIMDKQKQRKRERGFQLVGSNSIESNFYSKILTTHKTNLFICKNVRIQKSERKIKINFSVF